MKKLHDLFNKLWVLLYFIGLMLMCIGSVTNDICSTIQGAAFFLGGTYILSPNKIMPLPIPVPMDFYKEEKKDEN